MIMQLPTTTIITSLAVLSSVAYSSPPLAFTTTTTTTNYNNAPPRIFSSKVKRRVLARSFLTQQYATSTTEEQKASEFTSQSKRSRSNSRSSSNNSSSNKNRPTTNTADSITKRNTDIDTDNIDNNISSTTLSMIVDSQKEFEMNLGRAVDTLKSDYPNLLSKNPSWDIYHDELEVIDPTGVSLHGLDNYKLAFSFIHGVVNWFYCEEKSGVTSVRATYDWARKAIRVSWNVELIPKMIYGGSNRKLHVDGISEYHLDRESGLITEHKVTHLLINDQAVRPENGIFAALAEMRPLPHDPEGVPVFFKADKDTWDEMTHVKFQTWNPLTQRSTTSLFQSNPNEQAMQLPESSRLSYDSEAFQRKNDSRKKFGLPALTPEEFTAIEKEVRAMDEVNKKKATYLAEQFAQNAQNSKEKTVKGNFIQNLFGGALKNGCESNFDCERPQVCCDVGFKKICCSNGLGIVDGIPVEKYKRGVLRVPMPGDDYGYPGNDGQY